MENELSVAQYIGVAFFTIIIIATVIITIFYIIPEHLENIKNLEITVENYSNIKDIVNNSNDITLQEKANFNKNYLLFGKKIIGYRVKDVIKEIEI